MAPSSGKSGQKHRFKTRSPAMSLTGPAKDFPDSQIIKMTMELTYSQWLSVKKLFGIIIFSIGKIKLKLF